MGRRSPQQCVVVKCKRMPADVGAGACARLSLCVSPLRGGFATVCQSYLGAEALSFSTCWKLWGEYQQKSRPVSGRVWTQLCFAFHYFPRWMSVAIFLVIRMQKVQIWQPELLRFNFLSPSNLTWQHLLKTFKSTKFVFTCFASLLFKGKQFFSYSHDPLGRCHQ